MQVPRSTTTTANRKPGPRNSEPWLPCKIDRLPVAVCLYPCPPPALVPADLYSAETVVADEGSETRNAALSQLLGSIMARVSGNADIAGQPAAKQMLAAALRWFSNTATGPRTAMEAWSATCGRASISRWSSV